MKKTLVALAVLAASGASMAQSTVTLYGIADVWFGTQNDETATAAGVTSLSQTKVNAGALNTNRFGLRGSEDLGAGLKANFQFEQGFDIDTGNAKAANSYFAATTSSAAFARQAWVGVSGGFGSTRIGMTTTAFDDVSGASNAVFDSSFSPAGDVFKSAGYTGRPGNTLYYATPSFGGFAGAVSYSLGENKTATVDAGAVTSFNATYSAGPLAAQLGYQTEKVTGNLTAKDFTRVSGSYDFGAAKLLGGYGKAAGIGNVSGAEASEYAIGVDVPFGATVLSAQYATSQDNATAGDGKRTGYGFGAKYSLSKRTALYGGYEAVTTSATGLSDARDTLLAVGINHKF